MRRLWRAGKLVRAYVLWYPGLLDEASQECEKAGSLDPGTIPSVLEPYARKLHQEAQA